MSLLTRFRSLAARRTRPAPAARRLCLQPLEDRAVPSTVVDQLTDNADPGKFVGAPALSADGTRIAFLSNLNLTGQNADGNTELFLYTTTTGVFTQVTNTTGFAFTGEPAVSGDGGWVVFTTNADLTGGNADGNAELFRYNTATATLTQVTDTTGGSLFANQAPTVSADGTRIAFVSNRDLVPVVGNLDGNAELFLWNSGTGAFTQATNTTGGYDMAVLGPAISADGSRVAFLSNRDLVAGQNADGSADYFLYDVGTGSFTQLTAIPAPGGIFRLPEVNADGSRVAFTTTANLTGANADSSFEVFLWDAGTGLTQVTNSAADSVATALSEDGSRLALSSFADLTGANADGNQEVFLYDTATGAFTQVTDTTGPDPWAVWSDAPAMTADGTRLAVLSTADLTGTGSNADGSPELFLVTVGKVAEPPAAPTPAEQLAALTADVKALVAAGKLKPSQASGLLNKLKVARKHLDAGRPAKAAQMLKAFVKQVEAFVKAKHLPAADGAALVSAARGLIDELT